MFRLGDSSPHSYVSLSYWRRLCIGRDTYVDTYWALPDTYGELGIGFKCRPSSPFFLRIAARNKKVEDEYLPILRFLDRLDYVVDLHKVVVDSNTRCRRACGDA